MSGCSATDKNAKIRDYGLELDAHAKSVDDGRYAAEKPREILKVAVRMELDSKKTASS